MDLVIHFTCTLDHCIKMQFNHPQVLCWQQFLILPHQGSQSLWQIWCLPTSDQVQLLKLWDEIGLPHKEEKQFNGSCIPIIGFEVDPNALTGTMSEPKRLKLIKACTAFTIRGARKNLREFQRLQARSTGHWMYILSYALPFANHTRKLLAKPAQILQFGSTILWGTSFVGSLTTSNSQMAFTC